MNAHKGIGGAKSSRPGNREDNSLSSDDQIGVQSVETGAQLLEALAVLTRTGPPPMLKTLAEAAAMAPAKAHRYIVSFLRTGIVERDDLTGRYRLGPLSRHIGLSAILSLNPVRIAGAKLPEICERVGNTVALAVWAPHGPTMVRVEEVFGPVVISTRAGQVMPMLSSATGRVFGAWLPPMLTQPLIEKELVSNARRPGAKIKSRKDVDKLFDDTRRAGIGSVLGELNPSINALSAPVFDYRDKLVAAVSSLGPANLFDARPDGALARRLKDAAAQISIELGHVPA